MKTKAQIVVTLIAFAAVNTANAESVSVASTSTSAVTETVLAQPSVTLLPTPTTATTTQVIVTSPAPVASAPAPAPTMAAAPAEVVIEKQPTTVVEAAPLSLSKAEELRKSREETEVDTERKIVEKLEQARIEAEKKRQAQLLNAFEGAAAGTAAAVTATPVEKPAAAAVETKAPPVAAAQPIQPQVIVVQPAAAPAPAVEAAKPVTIDDVRGAVREELRASQPEVEETPEKKSENYIAVNVGMLDYDSADIQTNGAVNLAFGKIFEDRWAVDFGVGLASAYVDESAFAYRKLDQFSLGVGAKFLILTGRIRPSIGGVLNFVNRQYSTLRDSTTGQPIYTDELNSDALEAGFVMGVDFLVSENLVLGAEYRFMSNLTYQYDVEVFNTPGYRNAYGSNVTPLEERDSHFLGFAAKYLF